MLRYCSSLPMLIMTEYPNHCWMAWEFERLPKNWFRDVSDLLFASKKVKQTDIVLATMLDVWIHDLAMKYNVRDPYDTNQWKDVKLDTRDNKVAARLGSIYSTIAYIRGEHVHEEGTHSSKATEYSKFNTLPSRAALPN